MTWKSMDDNMRQYKCANKNDDALETRNNANFNVYVKKSRLKCSIETSTAKTFPFFSRNTLSLIPFSTSFFLLL